MPEVRNPEGRSCLPLNRDAAEEFSWRSVMSSQFASPNPSRRDTVLQLPALLSVLTADQICHVDSALARVGAYGEVRLVVQRGQLRFIQTLRSEDVGGIDR